MTLYLPGRWGEWGVSRGRGPTGFNAPTFKEWCSSPPPGLIGNWASGLAHPSPSGPRCPFPICHRSGSRGERLENGGTQLGTCIATLASIPKALQTLPCLEILLSLHRSHTLSGLRSGAFLGALRSQHRNSGPQPLPHAQESGSPALFRGSPNVQGLPPPGSGPQCRPLPAPPPPWQSRPSPTSSRSSRSSSSSSSSSSPSSTVEYSCVKGTAPSAEWKRRR